jgi:thiol-disulfide isomerase/thioredoxin
MLALMLALPVSSQAGLEEANLGSGGQPLDVKSLVTSGRITVIEFFSPACPPCLRLAPLMERLAAARRDLAVKKLDINRPGVRGIDWQSPLAQQNQIRSVPYFMIFNSRRKLTATGREAAQQVEEWLREAGILK